MKLEICDAQGSAECPFCGGIVSEGYLHEQCDDSVQLIADECPHCHRDISYFDKGEHITVCSHGNDEDSCAECEEEEDDE